MSQTVKKKKNLCCKYILKTDSCPFKMLFCAILGEEISGSEGSGSDEMDEGDDEGGEAGEGRRRRRGKNCNNARIDSSVQ